jgi:uncharacterized protein (DUF2267 family)
MIFGLRRSREYDDPCRGWDWTFRQRYPVALFAGQARNTADEVAMKDKTFVRDVADRFGCDERRAETLIFAVFQELRDRLAPAAAEDVAAQLPTSLKMIWLSFNYPGRRVGPVHDYQFLKEARQILGLGNDGRAEAAIVAVFSILQESLGCPNGREEEASQVFSQLPSDLKELWLTAAGQNLQAIAHHRRQSDRSECLR